MWKLEKIVNTNRNKISTIMKFGNLDDLGMGECSRATGGRSDRLSGTHAQEERKAHLLVW